MKNKLTERNIILETLARIFFIPPGLPPIVQVEVTNRCNLDCKMCPRNFINIKHGDTDFDFFKTLIDGLEGVSEIILCGMGEPLLHPQFVDMIKYTHQAGFKTRTTSNALLLTDSKMDEIVSAGLDEITFSVDSICSSESDLGHVGTSQIEKISRFAAKFPSFPVIIQSIISKDKENDIIDVIDFAKQIGARVNIGRLDMRHCDILKRPNYKEEKLIVSKLVKHGDKHGVSVNCMCHSINRGIKRHIYKVIKGLLCRKGKYCLRVYDYVYVNGRGGVTPCSAIPAYSDEVGSLLEESLESIWHGKKMAHFRENQRKFCGKCDIFSIKQAS